ncbi:MAG: VWA domain-containing protein [Acidithiobacillus sp.]|nr:VWA domain-containing protein [Acidithiobacillus sp.]
MAVDLHKSSEKAGIQLKKHGVDTSRLPNMRVGVCLDISGSMNEEYRDGHVQDALTHLLALAMHMDKSAKIDVFIFNHGAQQMPEPATLQNYAGYVDRYISDHVGGGTDYAPVIHLTYQHYYPALDHLHSAASAARHVASLAHHGHGLLGSLFGHHKHDEPPAAPTVVNPADHDPVFMLFLTDGDNGDKEATRHAVHAATGLPLFWSFVGLAHNSRFLEELSRETDAEFVHLEDGIRISDDDLYRQLISAKLGAWLRNLHV